MHDHLMVIGKIAGFEAFPLLILSDPFKELVVLNSHQNVLYGP
jgi:hypothetical protein